MGNQSTSGIVDQEKAKNKTREASSPDELKQQDETKDFQEQDFDDAEAEADKSHPVEKLTFVEKDEHEGSVDGDTTHEAVNISSEPQGDHSMLETEIVDTLESDDSCQIEAESCPVDTMTTLNIDEHIEKNEDNLVHVADMPSVLVEMCAHDEEVDMVRGDDHPQVEQSNSYNSLNDLPSISLLPKNEKQNESVAVAEENLMMNELGNVDNINYNDETQPPNQETNQFLSSSNPPPEMLKSENREENAIEINSFSGLEKVDLVEEVEAVDERGETGSRNSLKSIPSEELNNPNVEDIESVQIEGSIVEAEEREDDKPEGESILETVVIIENGDESETGVVKKCVLQRQSSLETPCQTRFSDSETTLLSESMAHKVELRKAPSFDFGLTFDSRYEESDKTPLLYEGKTALRSFSSCSNTRFQNRSVQTEFLCKSLEYEAVEVQEKTIRMERSNSNAVIETKKENSASEKKQDNDIKASDDAAISPKGNGKRKTRSSLFTTCLCCTAAIS